jgi:hypothetical protein
VPKSKVDSFLYNSPGFKIDEGKLGWFGASG